MNSSLIFAGLLSTLLFFVPFDSNAAERKCGKNYEHVAKMVYDYVSQVVPDDQTRQKVEEYLDECTVASRAYPPAKRKDFSELIQEELDLLDDQKLEALVRKNQKPDNQTLAGQMDKRIEAIEKMRIKLMLAAREVAKEPKGDNWLKDFDFKFYLGYEGTSVAGLKEKGTARAGLMIYNQVTGALVEKKIGLHLFGNIVMTSSAEESDQSVSSAAEVEPALETDINLFIPYPIAPQNGGELLMALGPIGYFALRKVDSEDEFTRKYYGGFRLAHGPESYFDVLAGKTEGIRGKRLELRGQLPVAKAFNGNFLLGGIANIGLEDVPENTDSLRAYVAWQVSFSDILGY